MSALFVTLVMGGCTFVHKDFANCGKNYDKTKLHLLTIGDDKQEVVSKIGEPVNVIGSKQFEEGSVEVWSYEKWHARFGYDRIEDEYWLCFPDGKLAPWGCPGDWLREADRIYEVRVRVAIVYAYEYFGSQPLEPSLSRSNSPQTEQ